MSEEIPVSVIIPARNAAGTIGETLAALRSQDLASEYEVIVVDNGSTDETRQIVVAAGARLIRRKGGWPGESRNLGAREARGRILAFTDADCVPAANWLSEGCQALEAVDLVQGAVQPAPDVAPGPFDRTLTVSGEALYETANLFVTRELFQQLGGFVDAIRADLERPFGEDVQFGWRARRLGARTSFSSRALVHHAVFSRDPRGFIAERARLGLFVELASEVPELRREFFYRRVFLSKRTAEFDLALIGVSGVALGALLGASKARRRSSAALTFPYLRRLVQESRPYGKQAPVVMLVYALADCRGALSLATHSVRSRTLVA